MERVICGRVLQDGEPVGNATVSLYDKKPDKSANCLRSVAADADGYYRFTGVEARTYHVQASAFGVDSAPKPVEIEDNESVEANLRLDLGLKLTTHAYTGKGEELEASTRATAGQSFVARLEAKDRVKEQIAQFLFSASGGTVVPMEQPHEAEITFREGGHQPIRVNIVENNPDGPPASTNVGGGIHVSAPRTAFVDGQIDVRMQRTKVPHTPDQVLWSAIRLHTKKIGFGHYRDFIDRIFCPEDRDKVKNPALARRLKEVDTPINGVAAFDVLKTATEAFLLTQCGVSFRGRDEEMRRSFLRGFETESESTRLGEHVTFEVLEYKLKEYLGNTPYLPYIARVIRESFPYLLRRDEGEESVLTCRTRVPCLMELIWSYWHEEGMLVQSMNAITRRFQNVRAHGERDPLSHLEIDPLRPLNNVLWGYIQDEFRRLTVKRRAYEYEHHYGLTLYGKAVSRVRPADSRSKFLEAFHNLLHLCSVFFKEDDDTTVIADGFPLLNALKEVHLLLAQGAHNQFGDMPWTARGEMMLQQWMLARPEIRDFLQSRAMVPYKEAWMSQVDTMKTLQGWTDVTITHFRDLGAYGEQILLSVRYGDWIAIDDQDSAKNWARYWRPEIQAYLHAYRAVTGIDLTNPDTVDSTVPAVHLQKRLAFQQQRAR